MEKNKIFAIPDYFVDLFEMLPIIKMTVAVLENKEKSVFLHYADTVGDILHYYLQKTQFTALEGFQGLVT